MQNKFAIMHYYSIDKLAFVPYCHIEVKLLFITFKLQDN